MSKFEKAMKIRVASQSHSREIQEAVFAAGGKWSGDTYSYVQYQSKSYLYVSVEGRITHGNDSLYFKEHENAEFELRCGEFVEVGAAAKIIAIDGKRYEVPHWTKFATRDREAGNVFVWEKEPSWTTSNGYYLQDSSRRKVVYEYIEPKPAGNFCISV